MPMITSLLLMEGRMLAKREDLEQRREAGRGSWRTVRNKTGASYRSPDWARFTLITD